MIAVKVTAVDQGVELDVGTFAQGVYFEPNEFGTIALFDAAGEVGRNMIAYSAHELGWFVLDKRSLGLKPDDTSKSWERLRVEAMS